MARLAGIELPDEKRVDFALTKVHGIGWALSSRILKKAGIDPAKRASELSEDEITALAHAIEDCKTEGDLRREMRQSIQRLKDIGAYRGVRHNRNLPVRGQRTRTNARTKRGKKQTIGAFKKEALAKMTTSGESQ